jgi:hypothetical protein
VTQGTSDGRAVPEWPPQQWITDTPPVSISLLPGLTRLNIHNLQLSGSFGFPTIDINLEKPGSITQTDFGEHTDESIHHRLRNPAEQSTDCPDGGTLRRSHPYQ